MRKAFAGGVSEAATLLHGRVVHTPVLESRLLNQLIGGGRLLLKAECLQHTGSFKYRGALHRLLRLQQDNQLAASRGVIAFSSGNFGQALAAAATTLGIKCTIVSPHDAPSVKLERIRHYGATLRTSVADYTTGENREVAASALAMRLSQEHGLTLLHPFDDVDVIHGQGTIGLEFLAQADSLLGVAGGANGSSSGIGGGLDTLVVPAGGGGMAAGICLSVETHYGRSQKGAIPGIQTLPQVVTVEPPGYDDHAHSFASLGKQRLSLAQIYDSDADSGGAAVTERARSKSQACDALMAGAPGQITWEVNRQRLAAAIAVESDASVARAMKVAFDHFRVVLEPSGALALAAVLDGHFRAGSGGSGEGEGADAGGSLPNEPLLAPGRAVGIIASGGNTDLVTFASLMGCPGEGGLPHGGPL